jgi:hypothetical protein
MFAVTRSVRLDQFRQCSDSPKFTSKQAALASLRDGGYLFLLINLFKT